ncbi:unnamed protein product, partial [Rotaria sp. Silwood2]
MQLNFCAVIDETSSSPLSSSSSSVKVTISKTTTNKRKPMLIVNGYDFQIKSYNKTKTIKFWRCSNRNCGVLLHTNLNDEFVRFSGNMTDHSHIPNPAALEIRTLREQMRQRAENELLPLQEIAEQEVRKGLLTGEALAVLPNILNLGHNLIQNRRKLMPPLPQSCSFSISDEYKNDYLNCDRLLLHDSYDPPFQIDESLYTRPEGRILVWSSDVQLKLMFDSEKLYMDGTFSTAPPNFDQVYIIQVIHHETCIPAMYALLPDRKTTTYSYLFHVLFLEAKRFGKTFAPTLIMTEFEPGVARAISLEFTEKTTQKGCFFHFCKAIYRNVQSNGLSSTYLEDIRIRSIIRQMMALALVPHEHVSSLFGRLSEELGEDERSQLDGLFKYFQAQWMRQITIWNVFNISERTNNFSEDQTCTFEEVQDRARALLDGLIEKYSIVVQEQAACHFDGQCEINLNNRHICPACRLAKCFKCGMSIDKLQESRQNKPKKKSLVEKQEQHKPNT